MNIVIIDDSEYKVRDLSSVMKEQFPQSSIYVARSFRSGVATLCDVKPDLVLLDMSLPSYDGIEDRVEGRGRLKGGKELLKEMDFYGVLAKVVVVSQYDSFGEEPNTITWHQLLDELKLEFPQSIIGGVFYPNEGSAWRAKLARLLKSSF